MKKILALLVFTFTLATVVLSQSPKSQGKSLPDQFSGLVLNETTPDEAIKLLGQSTNEKIDRIDASKIEKWLNAKHREKIFKQLIFKNIGAFYSIELSFLENKLVMIELEFKKNISPPNLKSLFGVEFAMLGGPVSLSDKPGEYPSIGFYTLTYPFAYSAIGISDQTFIFVNCSTSNQSSPGRVEKTRQISRVLEKK